MMQVGRSKGRSRSEQRPQGDSGWSLAFHRSRRLGPIATGALILAVLMPATASASGYDPASDMNSMYNTTQYVGATAFWDAGYTGAGVDVALIDTGVSPVEGLTTPGKVVNGPDLSFESQSDSLRYLDTNGHGTFMAGLIAGKDSTLTAPYSQAPASTYRGVAPDARIVSLKVGVADGGVDVSQVIAAIDWVVQHRRDNGLNIRVLNLSYGTNSTQPYEVDPLAFAVEQAWKQGIFVVAATGNSGYVAKTGTLTNPAYDPKIFAVGASDSMDTAAIADDTVPAFSSTGSNDRTPDVVAPGTHIVGLRVPGSYVDQNYAATGFVSDRFFRGSGTSASAAVASGEAALVIQQRPSITPNQLKKLFLASAQGLASLSTRRAGAGVVDMRTALTMPTYPAPAKWNTIAWSTGTGSLESARGSDHLSADGIVLNGEQDIFGHPFSAPAMAVLEATGSSWSDGIWNGSTWSGSSWSESGWSGSSWSGMRWNGSTWSGSSWSGSSWSGMRWGGSSWSGSSWSGSSWSGSSWSGSSWSGSSWSESGWSTASWN
jgi:subtilisin family serine protease